MSEAFLKSLKWCVMALAIIAGASAFMSANETGNVMPWLMVVIGFGVVYIMSCVWSEFRGKILLSSFAVFIALTILSNYIADFLYIFLDVNLLSMSSHLTWGMTMLLGIPIMAVVFNFIED